MTATATVSPKLELTANEVLFVQDLVRQFQSAGFSVGAGSRIVGAVRDSQMMPGHMIQTRLGVLDSQVQQLSAIKPLPVATPAVDLAEIRQEIKDLREQIARQNPRYGQFA